MFRQLQSILLFLNLVIFKPKKSTRKKNTDIKNNKV